MNHHVSSSTISERLWALKAVVVIDLRVRER
jgi:hypothetical protein